MDKELECDFYFGDRVSLPIKKFDYNQLKGFRGLLVFKGGWRLYNLKGALLPILSHQYKHYIVTGDIRCVEVWILLFWSKFAKKNVYLWCHGWRKDVKKLTSIKYKLFYKLADKILLYGDYGYNKMLAKGIPAKRMVCIYNSLDYDKQLLLRKQNNNSTVYQDHFNNSFPNIVYIGRLQKIKRLDMVIEAMNMLSEQNIHVNFTYIGPEVEDIGLDSLADQYNLSQNVWGYGPLYEEDAISMMLRNADICVSPENIGLTAIHSLSYGLPVITNNDIPSHGPEVEAIEDGINGILFERGNIHSFAEAIKTWLIHANQKSRECIAEACYRPIDERYNPYYQVKILKTVIEDNR